MFKFFLFDSLKVISSNIRNQNDKTHEINNEWNENSLHDDWPIIFPHELNEYIDGFCLEDWAIFFI